MKRRAAAGVAGFLAVVYGASAARAQCGGAASHGEHGDSAVVEGHQDGPAYRSPGLAAGLSLTPLPVDFGNLYAGNIGWGIAYTSLELGLMTPMMLIAVNRGMMGNYGAGSYGTSNSWTSSDRNWMIGLVSGYVVVKLVSGLHAAHAAEAFNHDQQSRFSAALVPSAGGGMALAGVQF